MPRPSTLRVLHPHDSRWARLLLAGLVLFVLVLFVRVAATLPFWYDEILTVRLATLPSVGDLWRALTAGFDFNLPLNYLLAKAARALVPAPELVSTRVPALVGLVLLMTGAFGVMRRRLGPWVALAAVAPIPLTNYAITYATDARPYMPLLGVAAWGVWSWQRTSDTGPARARALVALWATTTVALLLHVWAIVLPLAIVVGEVVRSIERRHVRPGVFVALGLASPAVALYVPLLQSFGTVTVANEVYAPSIGRLWDALRASVPRPRAIGLIGLAAAVSGWWWTRRTGSAGRGPGPGFDRGELAVIGVLTLSPLVPYLYAVVRTGVFMDRYALFAIIGLACLGGLGLRILTRGHATAAAIAAVVSMATVAVHLPQRLVPLPAVELPVVRSLSMEAPRLAPSVPIVLVNPTDVLPFDESAPAEWRDRTGYVADPARALAYTGADAIDLAYLRGEPYLGMTTARIETDALLGQPRLYLVGRWHELSWLPALLAEAGWTLTPLGGLPTCPVYEAVRPATTPPARPQA